MTNKIPPQTIVENEDPALTKGEENIYPQNFQDVPPLTGSSNVNVTVNCINQNITNTFNYPYGQQYEVQFKNGNKFDGNNGLTYNPTSQTLNSQNLNVSGISCLGTESCLRIDGGDPGYVLTKLDNTGSVVWCNPSGFIANTLCVGTVNTSNTYSNCITGVQKLAFDDDSGFAVCDLGSGIAKIAMNSTFKYWEVNGSSGLTACGLDTVNFIAGSGVTITSDNTAIPKSLTISASGGASPATPTTLGTTYAYNDTSYGNTFVGYCAGNTITTGFTNVAIGYGVLNCSTNGKCNIVIGNLSMSNTTCNSENIMIGHNAGESMVPCAWVNTGLGHRSFYCASASFSIGVGQQTLYNAGGSYHIAIGDGALTNTSGYSNIGIGYSAGFCLTGTENLALGNSAMCSLTNSEYNTAVGMYSMMGSALNPFACFNTAVGYSSMDTFTTSINNVAIGAVTLRGGGGCIIENVAVGNYSLCCNRFGSKNIGLGYCAGAAIITGSNNTVIGSLTGTPGLVCTVLIGAGTCERIKVDDNGLCINGSLINAGPATPTTLGTTYAYNHTSLCNTFVGYCAGNILNTGLNNIAIGWEALSLDVTGGNNIAIGASALRSQTGNGLQYGNIAIGSDALYSNTTGYGHVAIGQCALKCATSVYGNVAIGFEAGKCVTTGCGLIAIGYGALANNLTGDDNIAVGLVALASTFCGTGNIAIGTRAMNYASTGACNIAVGSSALGCGFGSIESVAIGTCAMYTGGIRSIAIGYCSGTDIANGANNTIIGSLAGSAGLACTVLIGAGTCERIKVDNNGLCINGMPFAATVDLDSYCSIDINKSTFVSTGLNNIAIGFEAMCCNRTGLNNIAIGYQALSQQLGPNPSDFGWINVACGYGNIALGYKSLLNTKCVSNVGIGGRTLQNNTTGTRNIAIGLYGLYNNIQGGSNIAIGESALYSNSSGLHNIAVGIGTACAITTGNENIAIGGFSLTSNATASGNTVIGYNAAPCIDGARNVVIGYFAGQSLSTGCNNILLGNNSSAQTATSCNTITLGNSSISCIRSQVTTISALSDQRDKTNIQDLPLGLQFIMDLRPVKFTWNMRDGGKVGIDDSGFIAQEVANVEDQYGVAQWLDMVGRENPEKLEVKPGKLIPILVRAMQELGEEVLKLKAEISFLKDNK